MKSMSGKELAKLLEANGWTLLRIQGSHHIYGQEDNSSRISIPIHRNRDLKIGLLRSLLKTAALLDFVEGKAINLESESESEDRVNVDRSLEIDVDELEEDNSST
ncbi:type II toxin-antitoxin system HicA family toxin [Chamaesiphon sp.]|uniref:type II toxin-antitoxin system HicA family toxin n=1 Tax=Chamaesiphon sp. TaxID=2814140 RepID=UPI0035939FB8